VFFYIDSKKLHLLHLDKLQLIYTVAAPTIMDIAGYDVGVDGRGTSA
jgi:hypothetical protein